MTRIKICGITNAADALAACEYGADAIGFVFAPSTRQILPDAAREIIRAIPPFIKTVGIFVDEPADRVREIARFCKLDAVQLHGNESPAYVAGLGVPAIKSFRVRDWSIIDRIRQLKLTWFLLDTYVPDKAGGSGRPFDWTIAAGAARLGQMILAGGLTVENVTAALAAVRPYAVDVSSGVEFAPGKKDHDKIQQFIHEVRTWDYRTKEATLESSADGLFRKR
ncbi:MAG: phosphoribosylanthranilate isomerase [Anaerolineales bacterium]|jgi:phosphoribosylanthranilate isomerase